MLEARRPQWSNLGLTKYKLDFGSGSKARRHYNRLVKLMPAIKHVLGDMGHDYDAWLLSKWEQTREFKLPEQPTWVLELSAGEWQALSRGLRAAGPRLTERRSFYAWTMTRKIGRYERD